MQIDPEYLAAAENWLSRVDGDTARKTVKLKPFIERWFETKLKTDGQEWRTSRLLQVAVAKQMMLDITPFRGTCTKPDATNE